MSEKLASKDYRSTLQPKWCPGCGCYPILKGVTNTFAEIGVPKENVAVISGIGCSSRFPYYVDTYGFHTIHGRAPTVAMGLKMARPELSVWVVSGDGDLLSIGGNHFIHLMRRNPEIKLMLFNNEIYGLTKGQASPTSQMGTVTKTTPLGSIDTPMQAMTMALAAGATFAARVMDNDIKKMQEILKAANDHKGVAFVEILFNCVTFSHQIHEPLKGEAALENTVQLEKGKPLIFGANRDKGLRVTQHGEIEVVDLTKGDVTEKELMIHDPESPSGNEAFLLSKLRYPQIPVPLGIFRSVRQPTYTEMVKGQFEKAVQQLGQGDLHNLLRGSDYWKVE